LLSGGKCLLWAGWRKACRRDADIRYGRGAGRKRNGLTAHAREKKRLQRFVGVGVQTDVGARELEGELGGGTAT